MKEMPNLSQRDEGMNSDMRVREQRTRLEGRERVALERERKREREKEEREVLRKRGSCVSAAPANTLPCTALESIQVCESFPETRVSIC